MSSAAPSVSRRVGLTVPSSASSLLQRARESKRRVGPSSAEAENIAERKKRRRGERVNSSPIQSAPQREQQEEEEEEVDDEEAGTRAQEGTRGDALLRLFSSTMVRGVSAATVEEDLAAAWDADPQVALGILLHARDCRSGKGEKLVVQFALLWLRQQKPQTYLANLLTFLEVGCFKDLLHLSVAVHKSHLPLLGDGPMPIEMEVLAEFLQSDSESLNQFKSQPGHSALSVPPVTASSVAPVPVSSGSFPEEDDEFELVVKPSVTSAAAKRRDLKSFVVVDKASLSLDLCFVIDCTGSMGAWISEAQRSVVELVRQVKAEGAESGVADIRFRIACVAYRDYFDKVRFLLQDFTTDVDAFVVFIKKLYAEGGGDGPEDVVGGLQQAMTFSWDSQADARLLVHIADAPGHGRQFSQGDSLPSLHHQKAHPEPDLRDLIEQIRQRDIRFSFTRITAETDVMLEMMQGWYDDRRSRRVLNVLQLGQRVGKLVPLLVEELTIAALGRKPVLVVEEEEDEKEVVAVPNAVDQTQPPETQPLKKPSAVLSLAGKWAPTEGSHFDRPPHNFASALAKRLFPQSKQPSKDYRLLCSALRDQLQVVERLMCTQQWEAINFATVPARCHKLLKKAFKKHQPTRYAAFMQRVKKGEVTIKTTGLQPHEVIEGYRSMRPPLEVDETAEAQWKALVGKVRGDLKEPSSVRVLALVDTSGSMTWNLQLGSWAVRGSLNAKMDAVTPIDAAMALALILTELSGSEEGFHDRVITFSDEARWVDLPSSASSTLAQRVDVLCSGSANGGGTDVIKALQLILDTAVQQGMTDAHLPKKIVILSDMDFRTGDGSQLDLGEVKAAFESHSYHLPEVIFWNVAARAASDERTGQPESGVAMVSGYSLPLVKLVLEQLHVDPMAILLQAVAPYLERVQLDVTEQ